MNYIKNELKRAMNLKIFLLLFIFITFAVFLGASYFNENFFIAYKNISSNYFLLYLIILCTSVATDDLEIGTFKLILTGKYSFFSIINLKIIIVALVALVLSTIASIIDYTAILNEDLQIYELLKIITFNNFKYILCAIVLAIFSIFIGLISKKFNVTLILMFIFFYGAVSMLLNSLSKYENYTFFKLLKHLPFVVVPNTFINNEITALNCLILILSFCAVYLVIFVNQKRWSV